MLEKLFVFELSRKLVKKLCFGRVDFASANEAKKALEKKNGEYLHDYQIFLREDYNAPYPFRPKYCMEHKVWNLRQESLPIEEDGTPPDFVEEVLFVANLSPQTKILHIKDFFKNVGEVVRVRLIVNHEGKHVGYGFVDFASANEAKKALETKNGEYLHDHKIFLEVAKTAPDPPRPKYNLAEKLCYEDYLRRQNLVIEEDVAVEGLDESPNFVKAVAVREKTLFVSGLSRESDISHIINFFIDVGEVVHVRLIVDDTGEHVGDGFVEFASSDEAEKALETRNGEYLHDHKIFIVVAKKAPYPPRPKYCIDHKVWYEDYLRRESLLIEDEAVEGFDEVLDFIEEVAARRKTLFVSNIPCKDKIPKNTKLPKIIDFFKDVGEVVCSRLIVDHNGEHVGCGFVEFASANEAEMALEKNGFSLEGNKIFLDVAEIAPYPLRPKSKVESLLIKEEDGEEDEGGEEDDLETKSNLGGFCGKKIIFGFND
ncbi:PREDICTED: protein HRB1-like isoform X2 [Camelina sativa]|uniref:Protein HRB1-like isoform X2 n=1 Tax=Camelina sativa TaxID=90675 RepID=A0ABM0V4N5_CAMSA|nr:PREDICTED: protein HRB1-like isoform X2 [Camelina sativa]